MSERDKRWVPWQEYVELLVDPVGDDIPEYIRRLFWASTSPLARLTIIGTKDLKRVRRINRSTERMFMFSNPPNTITPRILSDLAQTSLLVEWNLRASKDGMLLDRLTSEKRHMVVEESEKAPKGSITSRIIQKIKGGE